MVMRNRRHCEATFARPLESLCLVVLHSVLSRDGHRLTWMCHFSGRKYKSINCVHSTNIFFQVCAFWIPLPRCVNMIDMKFTWVVRAVHTVKVSLDGVTPSSQRRTPSIAQNCKPPTGLLYAPFGHTSLYYLWFERWCSLKWVTWLNQRWCSSVCNRTFSYFCNRIFSCFYCEWACGVRVWCSSDSFRVWQ